MYGVRAEEIRKLDRCQIDKMAGVGSIPTVLRTKIRIRAKTCAAVL